MVCTTNSLQRRKKVLGLTGLRPNSSSSFHSKSKAALFIGLPHNFRQISSIIDVDILPETHRRVQLHKHGSNKPLGFYIRDGVSMRVTTHGVEKVGTSVPPPEVHLPSYQAPGFVGKAPFLTLFFRCMMGLRCSTTSFVNGSNDPSRTEY